MRSIKNQLFVTVLSFTLAQALLLAPAQATPKKSAPRPEYTGVFLDPASQSMLRQNVLPQYFPKGLLEGRYLDHMTIDFAPTSAQVTATPVGANAQLKVVGYAGDGRVQALVVQPLVPVGLGSSNSIPHITVATHNAPPVDANRLVKAGYTKVQNGPLISGRVGCFYKGRACYLWPPSTGGAAKPH